MDTSRIEFELRSILEQLIIMNERAILNENGEIMKELLEVVDEC
jgi:hypothetical protein